MRYARILMFLFLVFAIGAQQPADAQRKRLKRLKDQATEKVEDRAKDKVEGKAEEKTDEAMDKALDKVEGEVDDQLESAGDRFSKRLEDKAESMLAGMMGEAPERVELGPIQTGSPNGGHLQFVRTSQMKIAGLEGPIADMIGRFAYSAETVSIHDGKERIDSHDSGTITDADNLRFVYLYPEEQSYWVTSFEALMSMAEDAAGDLEREMSEVDADDAMDNLKDAELEFRVEDLGDGGTVRGVSTDRYASVLGGKFAAEDDEGNKQEGKFYIVSDVRSSEKVAGIRTYLGYQERMGKAFGAAASSDGADFAQFFQMMQQNEVMQGAFEKAQKETEKMRRGLPIQETHYFVLADPEHTLDLDAVLGGAGGDMASLAAMGDTSTIQGQVVVAAFETNVGSLKVGAFTNDYLDIPSGWTESTKQQEAMDAMMNARKLQAEQ